MRKSFIIIAIALIVASPAIADRTQRNAKVITSRKAQLGNAAGTSGQAFQHFKALVQSSLGVTVNKMSDLPGKADDILIAANTELANRKAAIQAASNLGETKTAILQALDFMADLHRIELFMHAIEVRRIAGK